MGLLLMVEPLLDYYWDSYRGWADRVISRAWRTRLAITLSVLAGFIACFLAFQDQFHETQTALSKFNSVKVERYEARRQLAASSNPNNIARKLDKDQKARMEMALKLSPTEQYTFQLNSIISCEECELFAQDIRDFINEIPGWAVNGGPLLWPMDQYRHGIWLTTRVDEQHIEPVEKIRAAFASAGIALMPSSEDDMRSGSFVIVIGRP